MTTNVDQTTLDKIAKDVAAFGTDTKALAESTGRSLTEMRSLIDGVKGDLTKADAVAKERIDKFATEIEAKQAKIEGAVEKVQAALERPAAWKGEEGAKAAAAAFEFHKVKAAKEGRLTVSKDLEIGAGDDERYAEWSKHFAGYLRRDERGAPQGALQTGTDPDGGYLVPSQVSSRIITRVFETSPLRQFATVETIAGKELVIPRDEGEFGFGWVGETENRTETSTSQVGESKIMAHEMYAEPRVTQSMLEDAGLDIEAWMGRKVADRFSRAEAAAFINGAGTNQPRGLLTYPSGTNNGQVQRVVSGNATALTGDGLINLVYELKDFYAANARFMMKRTAVRDVVKMKDGQGNYLWQEGNFKAGQPATIHSYPVTRAEDFPNVEAGALPVAFGDFAAAYTIVDRLGISVLRDPLTAKPYIKLYTRRRVGGDVTNFEAFKVQVVST